MMNYIKSECYRVSHGKAIYGAAGLMAGLTVLYNLILWVLRRIDGESFRYATMSFSYSFLVGSPMTYCVIASIIAMLLYEGNKKNGNLKNTVAFGVSRSGIFAGECIVTAGACIFALIVTLGAYIAGNMLLLEQTGPVTLMDLLTEVPALFFIAVAALISALLCMEMFDKTSTAVIVWAAVWYFIPKIIFFLGFRFETAYDLAMWMPVNFFGTAGMTVNMGECATAWGTAAGMTKCIISGIIGTVIFGTSGAALLRKKEL